MEKTEILNKVNEVFRDVLDEPELIITEATSADDIKEWDSLNHLQIIFGIEKSFSIKFTSNEISNFLTVGDMCYALASK